MLAITSTKAGSIPKALMGPQRGGDVCISPVGFPPRGEESIGAWSHLRQ